MSGPQSNQPLRIFIGYDHRQAVAYNVLQFSLYRRSSKPLAISPLVLPTLPMKRQGLTPFTFSRFLVPWLCDYQGWALFLDIDFLALGDVAELFALNDERYAAMVSKNPKKFEWASMIMFNCGHPANRILTPDFVDDANRCVNPHAMSWLSDELVGSVPGQWNHLVGYDAPRSDAKLVHYTQGMPIYEETTGSEYGDAWKTEHKAANSTSPWRELMERSVHAGRTADGRPVARLHPQGGGAAMNKPAPSVQPMPATIMPHMALMNHEYKNPPFNDPNAGVAFQSALKILMQILGVNVPGGHAHGGDDLITWFRHLGFTSDPEFVAAFERYREDGVLRARLWRIYTLCWAARTCLDIEGDFVDIGVYDGKTVDIVRRYCTFATTGKKWWLYDLFDYHPTEPSKQHHGPQLADQVRQLFADDPKIKIVKGMLPETLLREMPDKVAFVQVDLNAAQVELDCLQAIYDRIAVGGMIVLDDYGFYRYRNSYQAQKPFFEARGAFAYECPTGQGIVIKRR